MELESPRQMWANARSAPSQLSLLLRKPAAAAQWVGSARVAQIALVVLPLLLLLAMPPVLRAAVNWLYPPVEKTTRVLGIVPHTRTEEDPRRVRRYRQLTALGWLSAGGLVIFLLLAHVPAGIRAATTKARRRESQADRLLDTEPTQSVLLYRSALTLLTDPADEASIRNKLRDVDRRLSGSGEVPPTVVGGADGQTVAPGTPAAAALAARTIGADGRYRLGGQIARGGMGTVYRGVDTTLDRPVALKELSLHNASADLVRRFRQEAKALARLSHPAIVAVHDLVSDGDALWMAMEYVSGGDLTGLLETHGKLDVTRSLEILHPIAEALAYAHGEGVIHRDVKPGNILLTETGTPKISDFGLAKLAEATVHTVEGAVLGSPRYMSPEQASGEPAGAPSDIYSFGITLYETVCGTAPFTGDMASVLAKHITQAPRPPRELTPDLPEPLAVLIVCMLEKKPAARPSSMNEVADILAHTLR